MARVDGVDGATSGALGGRVRVVAIGKVGGDEGAGVAPTQGQVYERRTPLPSHSSLLFLTFLSLSTKPTYSTHKVLARRCLRHCHRPDCRNLP
jgi:hypothetical protein